MLQMTHDRLIFTNQMSAWLAVGIGSHSFACFENHARTVHCRDMCLSVGNLQGESARGQAERGSGQAKQ